jgi:hypothetical protein
MAAMGLTRATARISNTRLCEPTNAKAAPSPVRIASATRLTGGSILSWRKVPIVLMIARNDAERRYASPKATPSAMTAVIGKLTTARPTSAAAMPPMATTAIFAAGLSFEKSVRSRAMVPPIPPGRLPDRLQQSDEAADDDLQVLEHGDDGGDGRADGPAHGVRERD